MIILINLQFLFSIFIKLNQQLIMEHQNTFSSQNFQNLEEKEFLNKFIKQVNFDNVNKKSQKYIYLLFLFRSFTCLELMVELKSLSRKNRALYR